MNKKMLRLQKLHSQLLQPRFVWKCEMFYFTSWKFPPLKKKEVEENHILLEIMFILEGENNIYEVKFILVAVNKKVLVKLLQSSQFFQELYLL